MSNLPAKLTNQMDLKIITGKLSPLLEKKSTFKALNEIFEKVDLGEFSLELLNMVANSNKNSKHAVKLALTLSNDNWIAADEQGIKVSMETASFLLEQQFKNMATNFVIWKDIAKSQKKTKYASLDDKLDGYNFYLSYIKFGLGRCSRDAQQDIRRHHITRDEGVRLVLRYDHEFPKKHYDWFLHYLGISDEEFWEVMDFWREQSNVWKKISGKWELTSIVS